MKKGRRIIILSIITLLIGGIIYLGVNWIAPYAIIVPMRVDPAAHGEQFSHPYHPSQYGLNYDTMAVAVADSISLSGYFVKPANDSIKGAVIFLHGISSCKEVFLNFSRFLAEKGMASALIDLRAHGKSGGQFNTYGYHEREDISQVAASIRKEYGDLPVGVWGNSLGGAMAYQALAHDSSLSFGVIQSTFADLPQIIDDYGKRMIGLRIPGLSDFALKKASGIANFSGFEVSPSESAKDIRQPVYVMHGNEDKNIKIEYGKENFDNIPHQNKVWFEVKGADHYNLPHIASSHVDSVVIPWVLKQMER
ncbi:MAG: alpha/beta hydrolase [Bacteroidia bacterium]|nr:alpha/beta hydrolase [Bacteroidia bacterium]